MKQKRFGPPLKITYSIKGRPVRVFRSFGRTQMVGSSRKANIRLVAPDIAGVACLIEKHGDHWFLLDLGSEPDVKLDGKPFVEHKVVGPCVLTVGDHSLELTPCGPRRTLFTAEKYANGTEVLVVAKWKGRVLATGDESLARLAKMPGVEVTKVSVPAMSRIESERPSIDEEMRKPLLSTLSILIVFFLALFGLPSPKSEVKERPKDNVYTRMIFDSKILEKKKRQVVAGVGVRSNRGTGNGNGSVSEGQKGASGAATKAVAQLRKSGVQSIIKKIAFRASESAKVIARLAATSEANASIPPNEIGMMNGPSSGAASGKSGLVGNGKGFKVSGIGTGGKGGGTGSYKDGSGLGTGKVGNGEVGLDDTESVVEGGLDKEVIAGVIREHLGQIRYCYERQLSASPDLYGKIKVKFSINANGTVESQTVGQTTLKSAMVEECILRRIAGWKFPKPKGGTKVLVSYPFLFKSVN